MRDYVTDTRGPRWLRGLILGLAGALCALAMAAATPAPAYAQNKAKAKKLWQDATTQFNLGNFDKAAKLYKDAYAEWPDPAFLFNIAQSYRQLDDCKNALFFYKRYILVKPNAKNRKAVETTVKELEELCKKNEAIRDKPPRGTEGPDDDGGGGGTVTSGDDDDDDGGGGTTRSDDDDDGDDDDDDRVALGDDDDDGWDDDDDDGWDDDDDDGGSVVAPVEPEKPHILSAMVSGGASIIGLGDLSTTTQFGIGINLGYPLSVGPIMLELGAAVSYAPVPWNNGMGTKGTSALTSALANVGAIYGLTDKIGLRGDFGIGGQFFSGLKMGNVFTVNGAEATGALGMVNLRFALGAEYNVHKNVVINASPVVFSFSPAPDGLIDKVSSIIRYELFLGAGFRM